MWWSKHVIPVNDTATGWTGGSYCQDSTILNFFCSVARSAPPIIWWYRVSDLVARFRIMDSTRVSSAGLWILTEAGCRLLYCGTTPVFRVRSRSVKVLSRCRIDSPWFWKFRKPHGWLRCLRWIWVFFLLLQFHRPQWACFAWWPPVKQFSVGANCKLPLPTRKELRFTSYEKVWPLTHRYLFNKGPKCCRQITSFHCKSGKVAALLLPQVQRLPPEYIYIVEVMVPLRNELLCPSIPQSPVRYLPETGRSPVAGCWGFPPGNKTGVVTLLGSCFTSLCNHFVYDTGIGKNIWCLPAQPMRCVSISTLRPVSGNVTLKRFHLTTMVFPPPVGNWKSILALGGSSTKRLNILVTASSGRGITCRFGGFQNFFHIKKLGKYTAKTGNP